MQRHSAANAGLQSGVGMIDAARTLPLVVGVLGNVLSVKKMIESGEGAQAAFGTAKEEVGRVFNDWVEDLDTKTAFRSILGKIKETALEHLRKAKEGLDPRLLSGTAAAFGQLQQEDQQQWQRAALEAFSSTEKEDMEKVVHDHEVALSRLVDLRNSGREDAELKAAKQAQLKRATEEAMEIVRSSGTGSAFGGSAGPMDEGDAEIARLKKENEALRRIQGMSKQMTLAEVVQKWQERLKLARAFNQAATGMIKQMSDPLAEKPKATAASGLVADDPALAPVRVPRKLADKMGWSYSPEDRVLPNKAEALAKETDRIVNETTSGTPRDEVLGQLLIEAYERNEQVNMPEFDPLDSEFL